MKKQIVFIPILFFFIHMLAQTSFVATVNKNKISVNDRFSISFTLNNGNAAANFSPPSLKDFYILGGPNQSSSISIINGNTSQSITFSYVLQPKTKGTFTIQPASIKSGGQVYSTQPVSIEVSDKIITQNNSGNQNANQQSGDNNASDINSYIRQNFYLKTEVSDDNIYKGEQITVTHKLYVNRNSNILDYRITGATKVPKYNGFYAQDVDMSQSQPTYEIINGQQYMVQIVKKTILTAQTSGDMQVDELSVDAQVAVRTKKQKSNDPFDDFFGNNPFSNSYNRTQISINSPVVKIRVNELPQPQPATFNGAVGNFSMSTEISAAETKTDEPVTYRIIISGNGNLSLFQTPQLNLPPAWETYDPKITDGKNSKIYEYLLIPRSPGKFNMPANTWSYFDPDKKTYVTLNSKSYDVLVTAGANYSGTSSVQGINKEDIEQLAKDIRFIKKENPQYQKNKKDFARSLIFYAGMGLPVLLGFVLFIFSARRNELESDIVALKNKRATAVAKKRLAKAYELAKKNEAKGFYDETIKALWGYLSDKLNIPQSELSKENIAAYLARYAVNESTQKAVFELLNTCEVALFAPQLIHNPLMENYKSAVALLSKLEDEIKR